MALIIDRKKLTVPQLARIWGVSTNKVVGFIRSGELRATNLATSQSGRPRYAIDVADIQTFEAARAVVPTAKATTSKLRRRAPQNVKKYF